MQVNSTGDGLGIILNCQPIITHGWMSFASWYSFMKNIPDATVAVYLERGHPGNFMGWCWKMKVPFSQSGKNFRCLEKKEVLEFTPNIMAIRSFDPQNIGPTKVKLNDFSTFVDYSEGVGSFVTSQWIDNSGNPPFGTATKRFGKEASANEKKILSLWDNCRDLYTVV